MKLTAFSDHTLRVLMFLAVNRDRLATLVECTLADLVRAPRGLKALLVRTT